MKSLFDRLVDTAVAAAKQEVVWNTAIAVLRAEDNYNVDISEVKLVASGDKQFQHRFTPASWLAYTACKRDKMETPETLRAVNFLVGEETSIWALEEGYVLGLPDPQAENHHIHLTYDSRMMAIVRTLAMKGRLFSDEDHFCKRYGTDIYTDVAEGYARAGREKELNDLLKKEYPKNNDIINGPLRGFIIAGNTDSIEALRVKYAVGAEKIAKLYVEVARENLISEQIPPFYKAILTLSTCQFGFPSSVKVFPALIESMERLYKGKQSRFNPYWMNSGAKLDKIIHAINGLGPDALLDDEMRNPESALYKAMNTQRITPITFFGFNHARSVMKVEDALKAAQTHLSI